MSINTPTIKRITPEQTILAMASLCCSGVESGGIFGSPSGGGTNGMTIKNKPSSVNMIPMIIRTKNNLLLEPVSFCTQPQCLKIARDFEGVSASPTSHIYQE